MAEIHERCADIMANPAQHDAVLVDLLRCILFKTKSGAIKFNPHAHRTSWWNTDNRSHLWDWLWSRTDWLSDDATIAQRIWVALHELTSKPVCGSCGTDVYFNGLDIPPELCKKCVREPAIHKAQHTVLERYGVQNYSSTSQCREKVKQTMMLRYGVENPAQHDDVKQRQQQTMLDRYSVTNASHSPLLMQKAKKTLFDNHRVEHPMQSEHIRHKVQRTCEQRYGVSNVSKNDQVRRKINRKHFERELYHILQQDDADQQLLDIWHSEGIQWFHQMGVSADWILKTFKRLGVDFSNTTVPEKFIEDILIEHNVRYCKHDRTLIKPQELDFYIPDYDLAIEVNGLAHHCELPVYSSGTGKPKQYHLTKTINCAEKNTKLLHITDAQILTKPDVVRSRLLQQLGHSNTIYARKTRIVELSNVEKRQFFSNVHIQGDASSQCAYALVHNDTVVAAMSFSRSRYNKNIQYELIRFANALNTTVVGGASRLFNHFLKMYNNPSVISYADRTWSPIQNRTLYEQIGFKHSHVTTPSYWYTNDYITTHHRSKYQKHKLKDLLRTFDRDQTEWQNMVANGWNRYWDCGTHVYHYIPEHTQDTHNYTHSALSTFFE